MAENYTADFVSQGTLCGHSDWVTAIVAGHPQKDNEDCPILISGSRDKSLIVWKLYEEEDSTGQYGYPLKSFHGHNHFITDLALSQENAFIVSSSWDKTLRLWDLNAGKSTRQFVGHTKEVLSCAFSPDNRQILSCGADKDIKLWNTLADCKFTSDRNNHTDWVSCCRYSPLIRPNPKSGKVVPQAFSPYFCSVGWDGRLKIWSTNFQIRYTFKAHEGNINSVSISPNGKYIASGGKDKKLYIWDILDLTHNSREFDAGSTINQIAFNPKMQWVGVGTENSIKIWDLMSTSTKPLSTIETTNQQKDGKKSKNLTCTALTWNADGKKLFAGFNDGKIRVHHVNTDAQH